MRLLTRLRQSFRFSEGRLSLGEVVALIEQGEQLLAQFDELLALELPDSARQQLLARRSRVQLDIAGLEGSAASMRIWARFNLAMAGSTAL